MLARSLLTPKQVPVSEQSPDMAFCPQMKMVSGNFFDVTPLVGTVVFGDPFTAIMALGLVLVIAGIALMSKGTEEAEAKMLSSE